MFGTIYWSYTTTNKKRTIPSIDIFIVEGIFEETEPFDWVLILRNLKTNEFEEIKTFGIIGDTLIRHIHMKSIEEGLLGFRVEYEKEIWYNISRKIKEKTCTLQKRILP